MAAGQDDPEMAEIAEECKQEAYDFILSCCRARKRIGLIIYSKTVQLIGLNKDIFGAICGIYHQYPNASGRSSIAIWCAF